MFRPLRGSRQKYEPLSSKGGGGYLDFRGSPIKRNTFGVSFLTGLEEKGLYNIPDNMMSNQKLPMQCWLIEVIPLPTSLIKIN